MALNYFAPGLGQVYSAALGAGIGTLVQGGSIKDAFKSALVGGATGALTAGFSGPNSGIEGFGQNIAADVSMGTTNIGNAFSQGSFAPLRSTSLPSLKDLVSGDTIKSDTLASSSTDGLQQANLFQKPSPTLMDDAGNYYASQADFAAGKPLPSQLRSPSGDVFRTSPNIPPKINTGGTSTNMYDTLKGYGSKASDFMFGTEASQADLLTKAGELQAEAAAKNLTLSGKDALAMAKKELNPSFLRKVGPSLALATAAGAAGGFFDVPEEEEGDPARTGMDVYKENPDIYNVANLEPLYIEGDPRSASNYPYYIPQAAAEGGEIFPRRVGGIMPDEGIPNKDSVRAMLMPGEFVMTTDAVKGLGGGDMNKGISNMYGVMRNLEQRGKAMA
jgi:hypothetical protein